MSFCWLHKAALGRTTRVHAARKLGRCARTSGKTLLAVVEAGRLLTRRDALREALARGASTAGLRLRAALLRAARRARRCRRGSRRVAAVYAGRRRRLGRPGVVAERLAAIVEADADRVAGRANRLLVTLGHRIVARLPCRMRGVAGLRAGEIVGALPYRARVDRATLGVLLADRVLRGASLEHAAVAGIVGQSVGVSSGFGRSTAVGIDNRRVLRRAIVVFRGAAGPDKHSNAEGRYASEERSTPVGTALRRGRIAKEASHQRPSCFRRSGRHCLQSSATRAGGSPPRRAKARNVTRPERERRRVAPAVLVTRRFSKAPPRSGAAFGDETRPRPP